MPGGQASWGRGQLGVKSTDEASIVIRPLVCLSVYLSAMSAIH